MLSNGVSTLPDQKVSTELFAVCLLFIVFFLEQDLQTRMKLSLARHVVPTLSLMHMIL